MKSLILASIIALSVIGIIGVQESFAEQASGKPAWDTSGDKVCGDKLCSPKICTADDHKPSFPPPLIRGERSPFPRIVDNNYNSIDNPRADEQLIITTEFANAKNCVQPFVWIIKISDSDTGTVVALDWISGTLESGARYSPSVMWMPDQKGHYTISMFIWESLDNPFPISQSTSASLNVVVPVTSTINVTNESMIPYLEQTIPVSCTTLSNKSSSN